MRFNIYLKMSLLAAAVLSCTPAHEQEAEEAKVVQHVQVSPATVADIADTVTIYGKVEFINVSSVASQFDGRLTGFSLRKGDRVTKGQHIGRIVPAAREALIQSSGGADNEVKEIVLISPVSGNVLDVLQNEGDVVTAGAAIVRIGDTDHPEIIADLPLVQRGAVKIGMKVGITAVAGDAQIPAGRVQALGGEVNQLKQTLPVRIQPANDHSNLVPGMLVRVTIPLPQRRGAVVIPVSAVQEEEGSYYTFVVSSGIAVRREITTGSRYGSLVEIRSGIQAGEPVVTDRGYSMVDGLEVISE